MYVLWLRGSPGVLVTPLPRWIPVPISQCRQDLHYVVVGPGEPLVAGGLVAYVVVGCRRLLGEGLVPAWSLSWTS